ncbi:Predicted dehydrogenase [Clostridium cavendishii DSM 21758]|uniref:Predicted dehydrogenase n=1 Tax=Clostridium cavendishii DSM 21758 TaxID=1121302 RepID=A0A1M6Q636_9CLOT|nr:Gfo/Idh/MocA family oxidoreductase [Clostridium cavendishii]SHK15590.1 Predicted dehydrogenase [Clostridium cavendishii DSM 21758]
MSKMKFAIIGCGRISYKHVEAFVNNIEQAELVAVCDVVKERAIEKKEKYEASIEGSKVAVYTDYKEMLQKEDIDTVTIATESGYHPEIAINAMNLGKHVIVEKPMALSIKDADDMIETAKKNNVKIAVCHQNRFNPAIQKLRHAVEANGFGKLINGTARILWNRNEGYYTQAPWRGTWELDGGTLMNQCIHNIDLLQWMMGGEIQSVYAECDTFLRDIEGEDFGAIVIRFKNGAIGIVEGTACVYPKNLEETLSIFGETGTVCIGGLAVNKIETWAFADEKLNEEKEEEQTIDSVYGFGHTPLINDFINAVKEGREPLINGVEGKKAMSIILAAYKSRLTENVVKFPLNDFSTLEMKNINSK